MMAISPSVRSLWKVKGLRGLDRATRSKKSWWISMESRLGGTFAGLTATTLGEAQRYQCCGNKCSRDHRNLLTSGISRSSVTTGADRRLVSIYRLVVGGVVGQWRTASVHFPKFKSLNPD